MSTKRTLLELVAVSLGSFLFTVVLICVRQGSLQASMRSEATTPIPPPVCSATNIQGTMNPPNATLQNNVYTQVTTVTFDCDNTSTMSACAICGATIWASANTTAGPWIIGGTATASTTNKACGSTGNTATFTDTLSNLVPGKFYTLIYAYAPGGANGAACPNPVTPAGGLAAPYTRYGTVGFQNPLSTQGVQP
jgi:hypothetical protein